MGDSDPVASLSSIRECLSESDIADAPNRLKQEESEVDVDSSLQEVDFSSDFTEGPGQNEIIKAIATRWTATRYARRSHKLPYWLSAFSRRSIRKSDLFRLSFNSIS